MYNYSLLRLYLGVMSFQGVSIDFKGSESSVLGHRNSRASHRRRTRTSASAPVPCPMLEWEERRQRTCK